MDYKKRKSDEVWLVNTEELHFDHPVEVVGQGAFGVVLLAEYRGTKVAIKRVLQKKDKNKRTGSVASMGSVGSNSGPKDIDEDHADVETGEAGDPTISGNGNTSGFGDLDFLGAYSFGAKKTFFGRWGRGKNDSSKYNLSILGSASGANASTRGTFAWLFPTCSETGRQHEQFKDEMRLLSRLRHPCITTVMGAVMNSVEPVSRRANLVFSLSCNY